MHPLSRDQKIRMVEKMCAYIPHAHLQGIRLENIAGDALTLRLPYRRELVGNPDTGAIHGGALTVLLDQTLGIAGLCSDKVGASMTPTLDLRIDHLRVAPAGKDILATASVYRATQKVLFVSGFAYCDTPDEPIARATGSWIVMKELDLSTLLRLVEPHNKP